MSENKNLTEVLIEDEGETLNVTKMVERDLDGAINFLKMIRYDPNLFDLLVSTVGARVEANIRRAHKEEKERRRQAALDFNQPPQ